MDKKVLATVIGIAVLVFGAVGYAYYSNNETDQTADVMVPNSEDSIENDTSDTEQPVNDEVSGEYAEYSEDAVLATSGTKLLFFHAPWCPQCRSIEATIEEGGLPENVTVFKVDYDSNQALRQRYGVTLQTTFVKVNDSGDKIDSYVAYEEPTFASVERELLR